MAADGSFFFTCFFLVAAAAAAEAEAAAAAAAMDMAVATATAAAACRARTQALQAWSNFMEEPTAAMQQERAAAQFLLESWAAHGDGDGAHNVIDIGWSFNSEGIPEKRTVNPTDACDVLADCLRRRSTALHRGSATPPATTTTATP